MFCADGDFFAPLRRARRVWAVGAIHGEADQLRALHDKLGQKVLAGDRCVYLGNYLGRGKRISETVDELLFFRREILAAPSMFVCDMVYLRGSQEEMWQKLLQLHLAINPSEALEWMMARGVRQTLEAYGGNAETAMDYARAGSRELARWTNALRANIQRRPGHVELMTALRRAAYTDDGQLLLVHAGIDPSRPIDAQNDTFWWGSASFERIQAPYAGCKKVIRGYDPSHPGVVIGPYSATVDAGAGFGGALVAVCFGLDGEELDRVEAP